MAQEVVPEARAFGRALYKPRYVGRNEALIVHADHAEVGGKRGEVIVCNLGTGGGNF